MTTVLNHPPTLSGYYDITQPHDIGPQGYFLFGSNLRGVHGAGAAKFAHKAFGAQFGKGDGFTGRAYAIPTKNKEIQTMPLYMIKPYIDKFISVCGVVDLSPFEEDREWFYVTPIGTGLAGYAHSDIAPMFQGACNCWFPSIWKPYLGDFPGIRKEYQDDYRKRIERSE